MDLIVFVIFAGILFAMYVALRRRLWQTVPTVGLGMGGAIIAMIIYISMRSTNASFITNMILGMIIGGGLAGVTIAAAWYFNRNESAQAHQE